jgi:hypothetical protein
LLADDDEEVDEVAVGLALAGTRRVGLTRTERAEAAARLVRDGADIAHVRYRLGLGPAAARESMAAAATRGALTAAV